MENGRFARLFRSVADEDLNVVDLLESFFSPSPVLSLEEVPNKRVDMRL